MLISSEKPSARTGRKPLLLVALGGAFAALLSWFMAGDSPPATLTTAGRSVGWDQLLRIQALEREHFNTMSELATSPDAVVYGTIEAVGAGRTVVASDRDHVAYANVALRAQESIAPGRRGTAR